MIVSKNCSMIKVNSLFKIEPRVQHRGLKLSLNTLILSIWYSEKDKVTSTSHYLYMQ